MQLDDIWDIAFNHHVTPHGVVWGAMDPVQHIWIPERLPQVQACVDVLNAGAPRLTKKAAQGSYGLKHVIERQTGIYIPNGAAIIAAYWLGLRVWEEYGSPNVWIGTSVGNAAWRKQHMNVDRRSAVLI